MVCSIFVNPTNSTMPKTPFYTRAPSKKTGLCSKKLVVPCFMPPVEEVYPPNFGDWSKIPFKGLDKMMEGKFRSCLILKVWLQVVKRLLDLGPNLTIFTWDKPNLPSWLHMLKTLKMKTQLWFAPSFGKKWLGHELLATSDLPWNSGSRPLSFTKH